MNFQKIKIFKHNYQEVQARLYIISHKISLPIIFKYHFELLPFQFWVHNNILTGHIYYKETIQKIIF